MIPNLYMESLEHFGVFSKTDRNSFFYICYVYGTDKNSVLSLSKIFIWAFDTGDQFFTVNSDTRGLIFPVSMTTPKNCSPVSMTLPINFSNSAAHY